MKTHRLEYDANDRISNIFADCYENTAITKISTYEYDNAGHLVKDVSKVNYKEDTLPKPTKLLITIPTTAAKVAQE